MGIKFEYEPHALTYRRTILGSHCVACSAKGGAYVLRKYTPDFWIPEYKFYIETKGKWTPTDRKKMVSVCLEHPNKEFKMVFMRDNYITKSHAATYTSWCKSNAIDCAVGDVKLGWFK